ncbi:MAG TPA: alkaline phosphatase family protein, partial [Bryobacterales bacterium]|nr:alkaline phosphatase family protein [Bryobacterales bacterium]
VVGVSMKDRSAILLAGHRGDAAYWFENACGCFITSSYYMAQPPAWLAQFNSRKLADGYFPAPWTKLYPDNSLYVKYSREDDFPGEWDLKDTTFPHQHRGHPGQAAYYENLRRTPFADELVLQAALEAMNFHDLGARSAPDVLAVGFSAGDVIGHTYGPFSQEEMDNYLRLDLALGKLIEAAEARAGAENTLVILAADHGVLPLVEWLRHEGNKAAKRVSLNAVIGAVQAAFRERFPGAPDLIADTEGLNITLNLEAIQKAGLRRSDVEQTATRALLSTGAVAAVYTQADLLSDKPSNDPYIWLFRNSFFQSRSPHLLVRVKEYYYVSNMPGGTGHGTVYDYDRHVPIVFMEAGIRPGRYSAPAGPEDIAPTLARMLGIHDYPIERDARLLTEVLGGGGQPTGR